MAANEYSLEMFIAALSGGKFDADTALRSEDAYKKYVYHCDRERAAAFADGIAKLDNNKKRSVVIALGSLYPLSRYLIKELLAERRTPQHDAFLRGLDMGQELLTALQTAINDAKSDPMPSKQANFSAYDQKIERLKSDLEGWREKYDSSRAVNAEKEKEIANLEKQIANLKRQDNFEEEIKSLEREKEELKRQQEVKRSEHNKLVAEVKKMREIVNDAINASSAAGYSEAAVLKFTNKLEDALDALDDVQDHHDIDCEDRRSSKKVTK